MAQQIRLITDETTEEEIEEINQLIRTKIGDDHHSFYLDYFMDETAAFRLLNWWLKNQMANETEFGNFVTIRDTRRKINSLRWTIWRVSLFYRVSPLHQIHWHTSKHKRMATAITSAVIQAMIHTTEQKYGDT